MFDLPAGLIDFVLVSRKLEKDTENLKIHKKISYKIAIYAI